MGAGMMDVCDVLLYGVGMGVALYFVHHITILFYFWLSDVDWHGKVRAVARWLSEKYKTFQSYKRTGRARNGLKRLQ